MSWPSVPIVDDECPAQTTEKSRIDGLEDDEQPYDHIEEVHADAPINSTKHTITERVCQKRPERGVRVVCEFTNDGSQLYTAKILCTAGESTGKYKNWVNVQYEKPVELSGKFGSYNWFEDIRSWHYAPTDESVLIASNDEFSDAKQKELQNWIENAVYKEVSNVGQEFVPVRWVFAEKENGTKKARLVARGFQEDTSKYLADSPTCSKEIRRVFLCILTLFQWLLHSLDVKTAFLQGKQINRDVFLKPPPEAATKNLWKLQKYVYGLGDASRKWYDKLLSFFVENGLLQSKLDKAFFFLESKDGLEGGICIHVDDMLYGGTQRFHEEIITKFKERFTVQSDYLKAIMGKLEWIACQTRPYICFRVNQVREKFSSSQDDANAVLNKLLRTLKFTRAEYVKFNRLGSLESWKMIVFADASFANRQKCATQGGYFIFIIDGRKRVCPIEWRSKKVPRVVHIGSGNVSFVYGYRRGNIPTSTDSRNPEGIASNMLLY